MKRLKAAGLILSMVMICPLAGCGGGEEQEAVLYIGYPQSGYTVVETDAACSAEGLIGAIAEETGWKLDLDGHVKELEDGWHISFSRDSAFFAGPPAEQKEEYFVYDSITLAEMILGSIQKTIDMNTEGKGEGGSADLYFDAGGEPIVVEDVTIPDDRPWNETGDDLFS